MSTEERDLRLRDALARQFWIVPSENVRIDMAVEEFVRRVAVATSGLRYGRVLDAVTLASRESPDVTAQANRALRYLNENADELVDDAYSRDVHALALAALASREPPNRAFLRNERALLAGILRQTERNPESAVAHIERSVRAAIEDVDAMLANPVASRESPDPGVLRADLFALLDRWEADGNGDMVSATAIRAALSPEPTPEAEK